MFLISDGFQCCNVSTDPEPCSSPRGSDALAHQQCYNERFTKPGDGWLEKTGCSKCKAKKAPKTAQA